MQEFDLPSPDIGGKGHHLRRIAAQAINYVQTHEAAYEDGIHPSAETLTDFFTACVTALEDSLLIFPVVSFTPTVKSFSIAAGATAGPTLGKGGSAATPVYSSSDTSIATVNSSTGAVTGVAVGTCTINVSLPATATYRARTWSYIATVAA
jgi:uncharacterized protein YjdB